MSVRAPRAPAVRETIAELCDNPPGPEELIEEVAERLRRIVPYDNGAWMTTDPETMLPTAIVSINGTPSLHVAYKQHELLESPDDVNNFEDLLRSGKTAAALGLTTGGDLAASVRHRTIHQPHGLADEIRLLARSAGSTWAIACASRAQDVPNFTAEEVQYVAAIAEHL